VLGHIQVVQSTMQTQSVPDPIRVSVVEDQGEVRLGLASLLEKSAGFGCAGAYGSMEAAIAGFPAALPHVALVDLGLPVMSGIDGIRILRARWPLLAILALTVHDENEYIFQALCAGADGYLLKSTRSEELLRCLRDVMEGGAPISPAIAKKVIYLFRQAKPTPATTSNLTPHELRILGLLARGENYKTSARILGVSVNTISYHVRNIYGKLHVHSRGDAVAKALRTGLIS
jgi:DNA-binding NarL/FixJ family response regulator